MSSSGGVRQLGPGEPPPPASLAWASAHLDRALLVLGDLTPALRPRTTVWVLDEQPPGPGLAVCFCGFRKPVASLAAASAAGLARLLTVLDERHRDLLAFVSSSQPMPVSAASRVLSRDSWMVAALDGSVVKVEDRRIVEVSDAEELERFYARQRMTFWCRDMLRFGPAYGARGPMGELVAAGGLNFSIGELRYAQLGALATDRQHRRRGLGSAIIDRLRSSLRAEGFERCGLLVERTDAALQSYYWKRGFVERGSFLLLTLGGD